MPRVLPRHVEKQWGIGGVYPAMVKSIKKEPLGYPKSIILQNGHPVLKISGFDEISGLGRANLLPKSFMAYFRSYP